ncbi:MAG TPA: glycosyltransferase family 39 protein [Oscillatoriaceae cyanobacterium M33_DOE_052]|nr:glycosyltransferase family 39 protein [Oscillatoriaceae cyanobacterium M33_DOE_052]
MLKKIDPVLLVALVLGFSFCLYGLTWGRLESWHQDEIAFQHLFRQGELPFNPKWFQKPPFHSYFSFFLSSVPIYIIGKIFSLESDLLTYSKVFWGRIITAMLFLGSIILVYHITKRFFGLFPARTIALLFASSAGLIVFSHFLTTDIPVMFAMLLAFYFAQNIFFGGSKWDYIRAGLFTGIATATKYNGLAIGITIVVAHILSVDNFSWKKLPKKLIFSRRLWFGLAAVPVGFIAGNPFAILDYRTFISDFMYNYVVTPVYDGTTGTSYGQFFVRLAEIVGWPSFWLFLGGFGFGFYFLAVNKKSPLETKALILLWSVFFLYYYKFGQFSRLESRFVMPILPYWLMASSPFLMWIKPRQILALGLAGILSYNVICSFYVGKRFAEDPRIEAMAWVKQNIAPGSSIESMRYSPEWDKIPGFSFKETRMPHRLTIRDKIFESILKNHPWAWEGIQRNLAVIENEKKFFTLAALKMRHPDYISLNSLYYNRFFTKKGREYYPGIAEYIQNLLKGHYGYKIRFNRRSKPVPKWIYPQNISALDNRITILANDK